MSPGQLETCNNWDFFNEYGSATKVRGTKPILASAYSGTVHSCHFYKYLDNAGRQRRHVLIGAGTTLQRVNTESGALTSLATSKKDQRWHGTMFERFLVLANQNQFLIGDGDRPLKYDGDALSNLGAYAPGTAELSTAKEAFTNLTGFVGTNASLSTETSITLDGASLRVTPGTSSTASSVYKTYTAFTIVNDVANRVELNVYIEQGDYELLATSGAAIAVRFESSAANYYEFNVERGELVEGWNVINFDFQAAPTSPDGSSGGTFDNTAVNKITWKINTALAASQPNIYFDIMTNKDRGTPLPVESSTEDVKLSFESAGGDGTTWIASSGDTLTFGTANATEGTNAAQLQKVQTTSVNLDIENAGGTALGMDISDVVGSKALLDVFVQTPGDLEQTIGIEVWLSENTAFSSAAVYSFSGASLDAGANTLSLDLTNPTRGVGGGVSLAQVDFFRVRFIFADATAVTGASLLYAVDNFRVNTPTNADGAITGVHSYRVTYITKFGLETNAGPTSPDVTMTTLGGDIALSLIPVSSDPQVVARNIYRTAAGGTEHLFVDRLNDNITTTYTDAFADTALGVQTPPIAGDLLIDNSPPPDNCGFFVTWKRTMFAAGNPNSPNVLYFSTTDESEQWPLVNAYELDERITGMFPTNRGLVVTTENAWWFVVGENPDFVVDKIADEYGAAGNRSVGRVKNMGFAVDKDGVRIFTDAIRGVKISENIRDLFEGMSKANATDIFAVNSRRYNMFLMAQPGSDGEIENIVTYNYLGDDVITEVSAWGKLTIPSGTGIKPRDFEEVEDSNGEWHLYMASADGQLYELFHPTTYDWTHKDGTTTTAITSTLTTHFIRPTQGLQKGMGITETTRLDLLSQDRSYLAQQGRAEIHFVELRISGDLSSGSTWTVTLDATEGSDSGTSSPASQKVMTFTFAPGESLKRLRPQDFAPWEHVRVTISNADSGNIILRGFKVWFRGKPGPFVQ
jgi:hypothetical protein